MCTMRHWMSTSNIFWGFWASPKSPIQLMPQQSPPAFEVVLQTSIAHHGTMPNNPNPVPTSINLSPQQLIATTVNILPTIDAPAFANLVVKFFWVFEMEYLVKSFEKNLQLATFSRQTDETLKMLYKRFLKLKEDIQNITNLEAAHRYFRLLESILTLHAQVLQRVFVEFGDSYTLLDMYNISKKLELAHAHYKASTMRPPSRSRPQPQLVTPTRSSHSSSKAKAMHSAHPSYLLAITVVILPIKLMNATFLPRIFFMIIVGKRDIRKLFVLPSSQNGGNSDYHDKIYQHLSLPLNQKPRHLSLPLGLSPPRLIPIRMPTRKSTMLTRGKCFKPMPFKFKLCKMNSNH